jgi:hypothetical protein
MITPIAKVYVLCFHTFYGNIEYQSKHPADFSSKEFADILDQFIYAGFIFVTIDNIFENDIKGSKNILLTIDDGEKSVYDAFHLVLSPRNIKPLLAIIAGENNMPWYLNWSQLEELQSCGCQIAAHGWSHIRNEQVLKESRLELEDKLGKPVVVYVYPYGIIVNNKLVLDGGYLLAFGLGQRPIYLPIDDTLKYRLPRYVFDRYNYQILIDQIVRNSRILIPELL